MNFDGCPFTSGVSTIASL
jgi:hypothetical protein